MTANHQKLTGLCSYVLRTTAGQYLYSARRGDCGFDYSSAAVWLWTPEQAQSCADKVATAIQWAGALMPVRAR